MTREDFIQRVIVVCKDWEVEEKNKETLITTSSNCTILIPNRDNQRNSTIEITTPEGYFFYDVDEFFKKSILEINGLLNFFLGTIPGQLIYGTIEDKSIRNIISISDENFIGNLLEMLYYKLSGKGKIEPLAIEEGNTLSTKFLGEHEYFYNRLIVNYRDKKHLENISSDSFIFSITPENKKKIIYGGVFSLINPSVDFRKMLLCYKGWTIDSNYTPEMFLKTEYMEKDSDEISSTVWFLRKIIYSIKYDKTNRIPLTYIKVNSYKNLNISKDYKFFTLEFSKELLHRIPTF